MSETIGFKEWQVVCDALASGRQTVILRKGGIHEGRSGFSFAHPAFYLFPTRFHAQGSQVTEGNVTPMPEWEPGEPVTLTHHAEAVWARTLTDWREVEAIAPFHIYSPELVRERFDWQGKGMTKGSIHVAFVKISRLKTPWVFPYHPKFGGCRSWIELPPPESRLDRSVPVLTDEQFEENRVLIEQLSPPSLAD